VLSNDVSVGNGKIRPFTESKLLNRLLSNLKYMITSGIYALISNFIRRASVHGTAGRWMPGLTINLAKKIAKNF